MIQRRHFLGSVVVLGATSGVGSRFASAGPNRDRLDWHCEIIETLPKPGTARSPVVTGVSLQPDGNLLAIVGDDHFVYLYDIHRQAFTKHINRHTDWVRAVRFSPNGSQLATAGNDRTLLVWDMRRWDLPLFTKRHPQAIFDIAFSSTGRQLVTVGFESWLRVYDSTTGEETGRLECPCPDNHAVAFSRSDHRVAAGGRCGTIRVWDARTGRKTSQFKGHRKRIRSIEFTGDGQILSAGDDQIIRLTHPDRPESARSFPRHSSKFYATAIVGDEQVATAGSDNQVHVWRLGDLTEVGALTGHTGTVSCVDSVAGRLVTGSYDTHVRLWRIPQAAPAYQSRQTRHQGGWNQKIK